MTFFLLLLIVFCFFRNMPILSSWVKSASYRQKQFILGAWAVTLFLPYAYSFFSSDILGMCAWNSFGTFYYFAGFCGYLLLGHFLFKELGEWNWRKTFLVALPMFAVGYAATYIGFKSITALPNCTEQELELFFLYCSPNVALMTVACFFIVKKVRVHSSKAISDLTNISKCGLGIYMVHYFIVGFGHTIADSVGVPVSVRIPVTATIIFLIC